ncbi:MAG: polysaccharide biosynthesis protein [Dysgonamonadaceae bacterium]|nr:polysaccharide biosynthesis protein [Dysgonamonadaceae bacterium]
MNRIINKILDKRENFVHNNSDNRQQGILIPKKIHYCWLSGEKMPEDAIKCIASWKKIMPEYELVLWDKNKFDVNSTPFTQEACSVRKWAFAADYIRLYAIYTEGGIYMDTDVYVKKSFDEFLHDGFFTSLEYHKEGAIKENAYELLNEDGTLKDDKYRIFTRCIGIQAAVFGGIKGHPFLKSCLDWYADKHFILSDGTYFNKIISPAIYADIAIEYGFRYKDEWQKLRDNMVVYPSSVFAGSINEAENESHAIHCCKGSWRDKPKESILAKIKQKLTKNNVLRKMSRKKTYLKID